MSVIEKMNQSFTRFRDMAMQSGLQQWNHPLGQELNHVTDSFATLVKSATSEAGQEENSDAALDPAAELHNAASSARQAAAHPAGFHPYAESNAQLPWLFPGSAAEQASTSRTGTTSRAPTGSALPDGTTEQSLVRGASALAAEQILNQSAAAMTELTGWPELPFGLIDIRSEHLGFNTPGNATPRTTPSITRLSTPPLIPPLVTTPAVPDWTYSHDETTFSRRLTRAAFEAAFHLLSNKDAPQALVKSVFKLSLAYMSPDQLRDKFRSLLRHGVGEGLDCEGTPFWHLGGAGTHYSKRRTAGPLKNAWYIQQIGPPTRKRLRAEHSTNPDMSHDLDIDLSGYEGEWFDPDDVEGYLEREKGCRIDPKSSFTEVLIDEFDDMNAIEVGSVGFSRIVDMDLSNLNIPHVSGSPSEPSLSSGSWSGETSSSSNTPPQNMESAFGTTGASEAFGLDMGMATTMNDIARFSGTDISTIMDQPLGLDLASGWGNPSNTMGALNAASFEAMTNPSMANESFIPVVKQTRKKTAWVDISRLVEGEHSGHVLCKVHLLMFYRTHKTQRMLGAISWVQTERCRCGIPEISHRGVLSSI